MLDKGICRQPSINIHQQACPAAGGLVDDNWEDILWDKVEYLQYIGLHPWYLPPPEEAPILVVGNDTLANDVPVNPTRPEFKISSTYHDVNSFLATQVSTHATGLDTSKRAQQAIT